MIKLPISIIENNPFSPICLWCHQPLERVGITAVTLTSPPIKTRRFVCLNHPHDINYTWKNYSRNVTPSPNPIEDLNDDTKNSWYLNSIMVNISPTIRIFYSQNKMVCLQKCNGENSTWGFVTFLSDKEDNEDSWPHQSNYDDLTAKVKGYLPFL